ncbi:MAG: molybdenum cofactor guanylyltransferase MobA [Rhizobiales bacterium 65-9]|nr:molybdenum cofactor guanylyltransferase MobA [Hyphomicrobiales bacterium]OJY33127.1 MAG: molybdenum cofactor guanylyltransferase MobA [Rhizobiales bacterium 65-9]
MDHHPPTLGLILAGGRASRMNGVDKALIEVGGKTILARLIERMTPQFEGLILNANGDPARFAGYDVPIVADSAVDFPGPLAGILAGIEWARMNRPDIRWIASVASDEPFAPRDLVARLHEERIAQDAEIACAASLGRTHPVNALWPVSTAPAVRRALYEEGERSIGRFAARYRVAVVEWPASPVDPFFNANTPEDIAEARRLAAEQPDR